MRSRDRADSGTWRNGGDNEVNIGLFNTWIVLHKMFAVILWPLFAHFGSEIAYLWTITVLGIEVLPANSLCTRSHATLIRILLKL